MGFLYVVLIIYATLVGKASESVSAPAMFVFGDSLADSGNNNYIPTLAKSNYPPYGIDFPQGPTGRFSNGKLAVDLIDHYIKGRITLCFVAELLGLPYPPPYSDPSTNGPQMLPGVNYASAASGILDDTGKQYMGPIPLSKQINNFRETASRIFGLFGQNVTAMNDYMSRVLVIMSVGSNDYLNNYLRPDLYTTSTQYSPLAFSNLLVQQIGQQLLALYNTGVRRFVVYSLGPIGCTPNQLVGQNCNDRVNQMVVLFNSALRSLIIDLNLHFPGANLAYGDVYGIVSDVLINPTPYGFSVSIQGCCGVDTGRVQWNCIAGIAPCSNRNAYVFWDSLHPTEALNRIIAQRSYAGPQSDIYPFNIQQLASQ
ncbi:GDSL lipase/esterase [Dillenia turbinata]|uniref:GDSL lipase/esterase n=1 Tax=Dillenia turbinata TaxID=194707 RepID=A0AAN8YZD3_9MAGN